MALKIPTYAPISVGYSFLSVACNPQLSIDATCLGKGITLTRADGSKSIGTAVTGVPSLGLKVDSIIEMDIIKSSPQAEVWRDQQRTMSAIGTVVVTGDSPLSKSFKLYNCTITKIEAGVFDGSSATYTVSIAGTEEANSGVFG